ncbi:MAG TPA: bifunctional phosphopantothenoylcysteine decarboxylase/phosphopantothenate--cysteine ligase CoaBC, partial [Solirubrobacterales bacterium]|nr:bifunctional phosphopantothenoylcysteine decarboxylase/phosphopantothenate--cysteine ligase CoaBC [Solirubrobacterales bacterium]
TQRNLAQLAADGIHIMQPAEGDMACGEFGKGRMPEPPEIVAEINALLAAGPGRPRGFLTDTTHTINAPDLSRANLFGRHVLVTAGPTHEPIDPVRFIGNRSSGRMGIALAAAAAKRGAEVTLVAANVALPAPAGVRRVDVRTASELAAAAEAEFANAHVLLMAAAPADFRVSDPAAGKLQRSGSLELSLEPTEDILAGLASQRRQGQTVVGFAAEHGGEAVERARGKLRRKGADLIVLNDVSDPEIGFESERNAVTLIGAETETEVAIDSKDAVAEAILDEVARLREKQSQPAG